MKKAFFLLLPYLNKKYFAGRGVRWIIQDDKGKTPYCLFCGNFANGVGRIKVKHFNFFIPVCKKHIGEYMDKHTTEYWELSAPCLIDMNIKFIQPPTQPQKVVPQIFHYPICT
jgi:hypothetical protein